MHRPIVLDVRQEDYRYYFNKRIYAYRRPDGFLVQSCQFYGQQGICPKACLSAKMIVINGFCKESKTILSGSMLCLLC